MRRELSETKLSAMGLTASARSVAGTFRQRVLIDGRHELVTDEPVRLGGQGSGPAPHELLPAALASCIATTVAAYGRTKRWDLGDIAVDVEYDNKAVPRRFEVDIRYGGELDDAQLARLAKVARACPLRRSLEVGFEFHEHVARREPGGRLGQRELRRQHCRGTGAIRGRQPMRGEEARGDVRNASVLEGAVTRAGDDEDPRPRK
jgi:putative redox protein